MGKPNEREDKKMANQTAKFYKCKSCEVILESIQGELPEDAGLSGFHEMTANTSDGASEKHVPVMEVEGNRVTVRIGSQPHPMTKEHSIEWVYLQTKKGSQRVNLDAAGEPLAEFLLTNGDEVIAAYAYCNLHGFWKCEA